MNRIRLTLRLAATLIVLAGLFRPAIGQELTWHDANGAFRGTIRSIAVATDGVVFACDDSGYVIRAEANGSDWLKRDVIANPLSTPAAAVLVHPTGRMFAVSGTRIYASDDKGQSWVAVGNWSRVSRALGCTLQGTVLVGSTTSAVFRSTNLGSTWGAASLPTGANEASFLAYDSLTVFAATTSGVYRSRGDGINWGLTDSSTLAWHVRSLARDPQGRLFAATDSGVYVSSDSGSHWTKGAGVASSSAVCYEEGSTICAGAADGVIYRTTDGGGSWQPTGATLTVTQGCLAIHPSWKIVAGTTTGLFGSRDHGITWTPLAGGLLGRHISAIGASGPRMIAADRDSGLYATIFENLWKKSVSPLPITQVQCVLGKTWNDAFVGTLGTGIYRTRDGGATWQPSISGLLNLDVYALASRGVDTLFAGTASGVFRSADSGATWTLAASGLPAAPVRALVTRSGNTLFAGTSGSGIFRSTNDGLTWTEATAGLQHQDVRALVSSASNEWLFAGTASGGVYASTDMGSNWTLASTGLGDLNILALVLNSEDDLFAATPTGIFRTKDHGVGWALQAAGFPASAATGLAINADDFLFAATDGAGVVGTMNLAPTPPPAVISKWMAIGSLQNWFSNMGCEIEVGRSSSADQQDGWRWPAQYSMQDMQDSKGLWIGTTGYVDTRGRAFSRKVVHLGPRYKGTGEFIPVAMKSIDRIPRPLVKVQGVASQPAIAEAADSITRDLPVDRMITNTVNTSIGITMSRRILQTSQQLNDNYIIQEYTFRNTGNTDADPAVEQPGITMDSVYFYFLYRLGICADTRYVIGSPTSWGKNTMLDTRGDGVMADPPDQQFRAQIAWHGRFPNYVSYDNIGAPIWVPYYDKTDTLGRLGGAQFDGVLTLHADKSGADSTDDPAQPSTTSWEDSDDPVMDNARSEFDTTKMNREFSFVTRGHKSPRHAWQVEPMGNFSEPTGDPALGTGGGFTATNGYGPYRLGPGESVKIVVAEASAGLSREKCISVGRKFKLGQITAKAKNDSVLTGRDSLFQTFRRAMTAYASGYAIARPPDPPKSFSVDPQGNGFLLTWEVFTEPGPHVSGYRIYRALRKYDADYSMLVQLPADSRSYVDSAVTRGIFYYYYITAVGDSLESSRFYTQTYDPGWIQPLSVDGTDNGLPATFVLEQNYPNPFNPSTTIRYGLPIRSWVTMPLFNSLGQQVALLQNGEQAAGYHEVRFDGSGLASGVYFYRIQVRSTDHPIGRDSKSGSGAFVQTRTLLLLR